MSGSSARSQNPPGSFSIESAKRRHSETDPIVATIWVVGKRMRNRGNSITVGRHRRFLCLAIVLSFSACTENRAVDKDEPAASLKGEWRVAAIDDRTLSAPDGQFTSSLNFRASDDFVHWEPRCAQLMFIYTIESNKFRADRIRYHIPFDEPDYDPSSFMPPPCLIGWPPRLDDAMRAMAAARKIEPIDKGGFRLSGNGRSVILLPR